MRKKAYVLVLILVSGIAVFGFSIIALSGIYSQTAFGDGTITWDKSQIKITDGACCPDVIQFFGSTAPVQFEVFDKDLENNSVSDIISVDVISGENLDAVTFTLMEINDSGRFKNDNLVLFEYPDGRFQVGDTIVITLEDPDCEFGPCTPDFDTLEGGLIGGGGATALSDSDDFTLVPIHFNETSAESGIFVGNLKLTDGPSFAAPFPGVSELEVKPGDTITIIDEVTVGAFFSGIIEPTSGDKKGIQDEVDGLLTAKYRPVSGPEVFDIAVIVPGGTEPGGGGGGLRKPIIVPDNPSNTPEGLDSNGSGCSGDCQHPTLGLNVNGKRVVTTGFSFNGHSVDVEEFYTLYPLIEANVGQKNTVVLKIYEDGGPKNIQHVGLAFGLGKNEYFSESRATISIDKTFLGTEIISSFDPKNVLGDIEVSTDEESCSLGSNSMCLIVTIQYIFRAPLEFNMVGTNVYDFNRNSWQNFFNHGIHIVGESMNPPEEYDGIYKGNLIHIFETGKNIAVDEIGNTWTFDKEWKMDYKSKGKIVDGVTKHGLDRKNAWHDAYEQGQELLAQYVLLNHVMGGKPINDSESIQPTTIYYEILNRSEDLELQNNISIEKARAEKLFKEKFSEIKQNHLP